MTRLKILAIIWPLLMLSSTGCEHTRLHTSSDPIIPSRPLGPVATVLPFVTGDEPVLDPALMPVSYPPMLRTDGSRSPRTYRALDEAQCVCLAVRNSPIANALDTKRASILASMPRHLLHPANSTSDSKQLLATSMGFEANEYRNQDAGKAMETYYRLAQAEMQESILKQSQTEVDGALAAARTQFERGLPVGEVYNDLRRQETDLRGKLLKLADTIDRLNLVLKSSLELGPRNEDWVVKPLFNMLATPAIPDADDAVRIGLATRPQLLLLRTIITCVDERTLKIAEQILSAINPVLAIAVPGGGGKVADCLAAMHGEEPERVTQFRTRVQKILAARERTVESEIRDAVIEIHTSVGMIANSRDQYMLRTEELKRLESKSDRGLTPSLELATVRLEILGKQSQWVDEVIALNLNRAKLAEAQGLLGMSPCRPQPETAACAP